MSETRRAALVLTADRLGVLNVDNFQDRLILQKSVYLLQEVIGVDLGYHYSWYLRGPYCSAVAHDAFEVMQAKSLQKIKEGYRLSKETVQYINHFEKMILAKKPKSVDRATWLEVLSSLHYLKTDPYSEITTESDATIKLLEAKPFLKPVAHSVFHTAWSILGEGASA